MKASQFTDAQKAFIIRQGDDGIPVSEICRKAGISQATYFNWRKKYAGVLPSEMRRLRELEHENAWLKKIVAGLTLDLEMLQDLHIQRSRLRIDARKWMAAKLKPKKYSDRLAMEHSGSVASEMTKEQRDAVVAAALGADD